MIKRIAKKRIGLLLAVIMAVGIVLPNCSKKKSTNTTPLPGVPTLISPSNRVTGEAINPILTWHYGDGWYNGFTLQVSTDSTFTNLVINQNLPYTDLLVEPALDEYTKYFWRVRATLGGPASYSNWSETWSFTAGPGTIISSLKTKGSARSIAVKESYCYLVTDFGLEVIDVSNPTAPMIVGDYPRAWGFYRPEIAVTGSYAYLATDSGLQIVNISNPASPSFTGRYNKNAGSAADVAMAGNYAYLTYDLSSTMEIIDISNPSSPTLAAIWYIKQDTCWKGCVNWIWGVDLHDKYVYLATSYGLDIVDISTPTIPTLAGRYIDYSNPFDVAVAGSFVYLPGAIIDVSNVAEPKKVGTYQTGGERMSLSGNRLFSVVYSGVSPYYSLRIHDISGPTSPILTTRYNKAEEAIGVDSLVYVAAGSDGLKIVQFRSQLQTSFRKFIKLYPQPPPNTQ